jgi:hypothetical protein
MRWLLVAGVVCASAPARAEELIPERDWYPKLTLGAGFGMFLGDAGALTPGGASVQLSGEVRVASLTFVRATIERAWLTAQDEILVEPLGAKATNYSLLVRHVLMSLGNKSARFGGDMFVMAGAAREHLRWDGGGETLERTQAVLGFGTSVIIYNKAFKPRSIISYQGRFQMSRSVDPGKLPFGCDGPCDAMTRTQPFDKTIMVEITWAYGR